MKTIKGVIVPVITPMDDEGRHLNERGLADLIEFLIDKKVHTLFISGTTGESPLLTPEEKREMYRIVSYQNKGRIPLIAQVGGLTTQETIQTAEYARDNGFDAIAIYPPFYFHYGPVDLFNYYYEVAQSLNPFPVLLYNIPSTTSHFLEYELIKRLKDALENLRGIKDSSGNFYHIVKLLTLKDEHFSVYIGSDFLSLPFFILGGQGMVSGPANVFPEVFVSYYEAFENGDIQKVSRLYINVSKVSFLFQNGENLSLFKTALNVRGISPGRVRPPLPMLSYEEEIHFKEKVYKLLKELNL